MSRLRIRCDEIPPLVGRRSVLAGIATLMTFAPLSGVRAGAETRLSDLVSSDGRASDLARSMSGQTINVRGYLAPSLDGFEFALSESSPAACQLCGSIHDPGATITIRSSSPAGTLPAFEPIKAEGRLVVDQDASIVRIVDARMQAV